MSQAQLTRRNLAFLIAAAAASPALAASPQHLPSWRDGASLREGVFKVLRPGVALRLAEELALPPVKIHCSILAEDAIKAAVADYKKKHDA